MFKFTFNLGSSAAVNPFTAQAEERDRIQVATAPQTIRRKLPAPPRRPSPPPSVVEEVRRPQKRGWVPTSSVASAATSQPTVTNGWIDTPAKYLAQASISRGGGDIDDQDADADFPPAKKRKTLTDSIISTAFSAALIGTAVGMTAYRMWRDRGKPSDESIHPHGDAPPPYQKEEWTDEQPRAQSAGRTPRFHKKPRTASRRVPRPRKGPITTSPVRSPQRVVSPMSFASARQEDSMEDHGELEDQMDWMGDKIRQLIEEGQKALGKEVVIKTDEQNDEEEGAVDDGMEGWEEEDRDFSAAGPSSLTSSTRSWSRRRPANPLTIKTSTSPSYLHSFPSPHRPSSSSYHKQSRSAAGGGYSATSPGLPSSKSSRHRLGGRPSNEDNFEVIYEPGALSVDVNSGEGPDSEDEDSRLLRQGIDAVRKAYNVH